MNGIDYLGLLKLAAPETIIVMAAMAVLFVDLGIMREEPLPNRLRIGAAVTILGCAIAMLWMVNVPADARVLGGMMAVNPLTQLVKGILLVMTIFTVLISLGATFTEHVGEYFALLLLATVGMMFMASSEDILMIFVSLELTSLSLYILTAFDKRSRESAEAALKYFLFGGVAAAFLLFGLSLLYGVSGDTNLIRIAASLGTKGLDPLVLVALVMTVIGFGFKIAAAPFHLWAPDTYQGAPIPCAAFIASGSKVASFFVFGKVLVLGFAGLEGSGAWHQFLPGWAPVVAALAAASMLIGNLAAIAQRGVKRLLAYSAIAHAGYMLLGLLALSQPTTRNHGMAALVYYLATYGLTTIGAFGVVAIVARGGDDNLSSFAGLSRRAPVTAFCLMIFMLSLAGIPPLAGFLGKFYLFAAAAEAPPGVLGLLWLVIFAIAMSAVSLYYYLQVLKQAYVVAPPEGAAPLETSLVGMAALVLLAAGVVLLGCAPNWLLAPLARAIAAAGL